MDRLPPARIDVTVDPPPVVAHRTTGAAARLTPVVMALASLGMLAAVIASGSTAARNPMLMMFPVMMVVSAVAALVSAGGGGRRAELDADRRRYLDYLASLSDRLTEDAAALRNWLAHRHPEPEALWTVIGGAEMWVRHSDETDFGVVRVGVGTVPPHTRLIGPDRVSCGEEDPVTASALNRLLRAHEVVPEAPITATMAASATVTVTGDGDRARALVRAVICQLAVAHSPADIGVAALTGDLQRAHWEWLKWFPHQRECPDSVERHRVVVVDGGSVPEPDVATTVVWICAAGSGPDLRIDTGTGQMILNRPDQLSASTALAVARRLAGYRPALDRACGTEQWLSRIGIANPVQVDPNTLWNNEYEATLRVPVGTSPDGAVVELDIREAAAGGMGPHGLCVGATGSGKSELLRTIALGMIARHSPEALNLILVDFKGGATFLDLARTRHTTAVITNLEDEAYLVERMGEALGGEIDRRQRILRAAGNFSGIADYHRARREGRPLAALPALFIIVDEFAELLSRHPEFVDVFVAIGRLGRSLGMHLLLASQRLDEGRLRGLESHLSYRICLKTLSDSESRMVIGVSDAYHLPGRPGAGYLKVAAGQPVRFQTAYVSGALGGPGGTSRPKPVTPRVFTAASSGDVAVEPPGRDDAGPGVTVLQTVVDALAGYGPSPHRVWLPPLGDSPGLDTLLAGPGSGVLKVPIGLVDRAFEHRRDPLVLDLTGAAGNIAILGAPRTGKTAAVRTFVSALAATHDPRAVQIYCLDFGGGGLADLAVLPHVGMVAPRSNPDLVRRTVAEIVTVLRRREAVGAGTDDPYGELFLVVDGWAAARLEHDDLDATITAIAGSGLAHGIHVVLAGSRWADVRPALRDQIGTRLELRLGDPADSEIDRGRAARVPRGRPGHGLSLDGMPMVLALPGNNFRTSDDDWKAPTVRLLPDRVDYPGLAAEAGTGCVLGIDEDRLMPVALDFAEQHLLVFGEPDCGKTAVLRLLCHEITRTAPDAWLITVDPRRTLPEFGGDGLPVVLETLRERVAGGCGDGEVRQIFVVVDDYDLAASALAPLTDVLPQARDVGLHMVVARRNGGAARALYDPVLSALREAGSMGLQMSGSPDDGPLVGAVRPKPLPPGRGVLVTRGGGERTIQVAWAEPA